MKSISIKVLPFILVGAFVSGFLVVQGVHDQCVITYSKKCYGANYFGTPDSNAPNVAQAIYLNQTKEAWVLAWYNWLLPQNPTATYDANGSLTMKYQPTNSPVYFLAEEHDHVNLNRHITMPSKPLIFPALNLLVLSYKPIGDEQKFLSAVDSISADEGIHNAFAFLDGKPIKTSFIKTGVFHVRTYDHNRVIGDFGDSYRDGIANGASQGRWGFVDALSPGDHKLEFYGGTRNYTTGAVYYIQVTR